MSPAMIQIYGSPRTSAGRCYLMLEEIGQAYTSTPIDMIEKKEHRKPEYLALNPNGKVPCLVDGDFILWESTAINTYLAEKYRPELLGKNAEERGLVAQWTAWSMLELQVPLIDLFIQMIFVPEGKRDESIIQKSREKIPQLLAILDVALKDKTYLVGEQFSLADINTVSVVNIAPTLKFQLDGYPNLMKWFTRVKERPSFQKFVSLRAPPKSS